MVQLRILAAILALVLTACSGKGLDKPAGSSDPPLARTNALPPCNKQASSSSGDGLNTAAVFVHGKALFGIDAHLEKVSELIPFQRPVDFEVLSAQFTGDGQSLLVHRDWEGRDSWWAANPDGTGLRRLRLPEDNQIQNVFRFCQQEFVGILKDGRFIQFDLQGKVEYLSPGDSDGRLPDTPVVGSPSTNLLAYVSKDGVVVIGRKEDTLGILGRTSGQEIHAWVGDDILVTGDSEALYVFDLQSGQTRKVEFSKVFSRGTLVVSVSGHAGSPIVYVVGRSPVPGAFREVVALDLKTLNRLATLPQKVPDTAIGAPTFSPNGSYEVWPVEPPEDRSYAKTAILMQGDTREVLLTTNLDMVSLPLSFHPKDAGFVFTDLSRGDTTLVFQSRTGQRTDLMRAPAGKPFKALDWNPLLSRG